VRAFSLSSPIAVLLCDSLVENDDDNDEVIKKLAINNPVVIKTTPALTIEWTGNIRLMVDWVNFATRGVFWAFIADPPVIRFREFVVDSSATHSLRRPLIARAVKLVGALGESEVHLR
jgi:hypothetical protein